MGNPLKKFIRRYLPEHRTIREHEHLNRIFGRLLHDPHLFHLNRRSATRAMFIGLFWAFMPMPFQMIPAAACAIWFRANLPLSVVLVWISNPLTIPPLFYFCYQVGSWILGRPPSAVAFELTWDWFTHELEIVWQPLLLGSLVVGLASASAGAAAVRLLWRLHVVRFVRRKKAERAARHAARSRKRKS